MHTRQNFKFYNSRVLGVIKCIKSKQKSLSYPQEPSSPQSLEKHSCFPALRISQLLNPSLEMIVVYVIHEFTSLDIFVSFPCMEQNVLWMPFSYVFLTSFLSHPWKLAALQIRGMIHFSLYDVGNVSHPVAELTEISRDSRISFSSVLQIEGDQWDKFIF